MTNEAPTREIAVRDEDELSLRGLLNKDTVKARFNEVLGKEGPVFAASIINTVNGSRALQECSPKSVLAAAFQAAALKLPITAGLGQSAIVPYKGVAQFIIMTRGYIQLAHRSGQYLRINLADVHEGELITFNEFTGEVVLDATKRKSEKVIGYYFFFELLNGYRHEAYWSVERCLAHGKKYSQAFKNGKGPWVEMPEAMCRKTVVKNELAKWGPLNSEMRTAMTVDQAAIREDGTPEYIDTEETTDENAGYKMPESTDTPSKPVIIGTVKTATKIELDGKKIVLARVFEDGTKAERKIYAEADDFLATTLKEAIGKKVKITFETHDDGNWAVGVEDMA